MGTEVKGNYELRIAVVSASLVSDNYVEDEEFLSVAEDEGTVHTLGGFIEKVNDQELDDLRSCYVRAFLVNTENQDDIISVEDFNTLYLYNGAIKQW